MLILALFLQATLTRNEALLPVPEYRDKLEGGWAGQMAGLAWGYQNGIEFHYRSRIIPSAEVPPWQPDMINEAYVQPAGDDVYMETLFVEAMQDFGVRVGWDRAAVNLRNSTFRLWHANLSARDNLQAGISAARCGHFDNALEHSPFGHADDIDWQIESDFLGLICPGQPNAAIELAFRLGHIVNYGDGIHGGSVMAAMSAEAFVASRIDEIIEAGRQAAPVGTQYRQVIEDVIALHAQFPGDWIPAWNQLQATWGDVDRCPLGRGWSKADRYTGDSSLNIDAKINGAYVFLGLLYGKGDFEDSLTVTMRCGQDTDSNCQNLGAILGAYHGFQGLPAKFRSGLDRGLLFQGSRLRFPDALEVCENLAREVLRWNGGKVVTRGGVESFRIARTDLLAPVPEQWPVVANPAPTLGASLQMLGGRRVQFSVNASDADGVQAIQWHFGDLQRAAGSSVVHDYPAEGIFTAICFVTDLTGNTSFQELEVSLDFTAPVVQSAVSLGDPTRVTVRFDEGVDPTTAADAQRYQIHPGVLVHAAQVEADGRSVTLTTSPLNRSVTYALKILAVGDLASPSNLLTTERLLGHVPVQNVVLHPSADCTVRDGAFSQTNHGSSPSLAVGSGAAGWNFESYLRFDLPDPAAAVHAASLRLFVENEEPQPVELRSVSDDGWAESQITWASRPVAGTTLGTVDVSTPSAVTTVSVPVDRLGNDPADRHASFVLAPTANGFLSFASKESATGPAAELCLEVPEPAWHYGPETPGYQGKAPQLEAHGSVQRGSPDFALDVQQSRPFAPVFLLAGAAPTALALRGGILLNDRSLFVQQKMSDSQGGARFAFPITDPTLAEGLHLYFQAVVLDVAAPQGLAFSDGLEVVLLAGE